PAPHRGPDPQRRRRHLLLPAPGRAGTPFRALLGDAHGPGLRSGSGHVRRPLGGGPGLGGVPAGRGPGAGRRRPAGGGGAERPGPERGPPPSPLGPGGPGGPPRGGGRAMSAGGSQTVPLRHRFLTRKGVRLHWEVAGPLEGSAPALGPAGSGGAGDQGGKPGGPRPLVLLHGFTGRAAVWRPLLPELARRRRVVAVDLLGHGRSRTVAGRPGWPTMRAWPPSWRRWGSGPSSTAGRPSLSLP